MIDNILFYIVDIPVLSWVFIYFIGGLVLFVTAGFLGYDKKGIFNNFLLVLLAIPACVSWILYDDIIDRYNANQIAEWHNDGNLFLSSEEDKLLDFRRKQHERIFQLAPALTDAISEIEQNIKEDELRLFALKDVLINYYDELGTSRSLLSQYKAAGIYSNVRIGIYLDDECKVTEVTPGSVADRLHIKLGDQIIRIGDEVNYSCNFSNIGILTGNYPSSFCCEVAFGVKPLKNKSKNPWGFRYQRNYDIYGAITIIQVLSGNDAEKAGIRDGDIIVGWNGVKPKSYNSFDYYVADLHQNKNPKSVLNILRNNKVIDIRIANKYEIYERNFDPLTENATFFHDKDYVKLVNIINEKYSLLQHLKDKVDFLYWEDKRVSIIKNKNSDDLQKMILDVNKTIERNKDLITIE